MFTFIPDPQKTLLKDKLATKPDSLDCLQAIVCQHTGLSYQMSSGES